MSLPASGRPVPEVLADLRARHGADEPAAGPPGVANTFVSGREGAEAVAVAAFEMYLHVNGLYPTSFPSVAALEHELVAAVGELARAPAGAAGTWTTGGTESCLLAALAARDARPGIVRPQLVMPATAHAAWHKAARYFGLEPVVTPVDPHTMAADAKALTAAITDRTVLVVVSAPSYGHGVIDPVADVAAHCAESPARLHVDACIGGWVLPFAERLGRPVPPWDFRLPGVDSISVDLHKYGYTPKGCSVLLHRTAAMRRSHYFADTGWAGYPVVNPTTQSSKSGGLLAAAWAVLQHLGHDGYLDLAARTLEAATLVADGARAIDGLRVLGNPAASLVALTTEDTGLFFAFLDELERLGWPVQPQLSQPGIPPSVHLTLTPAHLPHVPGLLHALTDAIAAARRREPLPAPAQRKIAEALAGGPGVDVSAEDIPALLASVIGADGRMAPVHALLDTLAPALREAVLVAFFEFLNPPLDGPAGPPRR